MMDWRRILRYKKLDFLKETVPDFFKKNNGYNMLMHTYCDKSELGLIRAVSDWISYNGGTAESKGNFLTHAVIEGKNVFIQAKIGRVKLNDQQEAEMLKVIKAGGIYYVVREMQAFIDWFDKLVIRLKEQSVQC